MSSLRDKIKLSAVKITEKAYQRFIDKAMADCEDFGVPWNSMRGYALNKYALVVQELSDTIKGDLEAAEEEW